MSGLLCSASDITLATISKAVLKQPERMIDPRERYGERFDYLLQHKKDDVR